MRLFPPPQILNEYENVVPGSASKILNRSEKQSDHRITIEKEVVAANIKSRTRAQHYSLITIIIIFCVVSLAIYLHQSWVAGILGIGDIALMASVFYRSEHMKKEEIERKEEADKMPDRNTSNI